MLESTLEEEMNSAPKLDELFNYPVSRKHASKAAEHFAKYTSTMEHKLLQRFGVSSEVELFSNTYSAIRKRISDKEMDDMSFFNTQRLIEEDLQQIYATHRRMFFEAFESEKPEGKCGGYELV